MEMYKVSSLGKNVVFIFGEKDIPIPVSLEKSDILYVRNDIKNNYVISCGSSIEDEEIIRTFSAFLYFVRGYPLSEYEFLIIDKRNIERKVSTKGICESKPLKSKLLFTKPMVFDDEFVVNASLVSICNMTYYVTRIEEKSRIDVNSLSKKILRSSDAKIGGVIAFSKRENQLEFSYGGLLKKDIDFQVFSALTLFLNKGEIWYKNKKRAYVFDDGEAMYIRDLFPVVSKVY